MWEMVKEGGWGALAAVAFGVIGVLAGLIALAVLALSRKAGHALGVITLLIAFASPARARQTTVLRCPIPA